MRRMGLLLSRRNVMKALGSAAGAMAAGWTQISAQNPGAPPTTISIPPRDFSPEGPPSVYFHDPDIVSVDPSFDKYIQPNASIERLWRGGVWLEGPAWSSGGR